MSAIDLGRSYGVLLHPSSLPYSPVCGTFGQAARSWLHLLAKNGVGVWQVLPLSPTDSTGSPYSSPSGFALNPSFLDVQDLVRDGYLPDEVEKELPGANESKFETKKLDFALSEQRSFIIGEILRKNWSKQSSVKHQNFNDWCRRNFWLEDHSSFITLRKENAGKPWWEWPKDLAIHNVYSLRIWKSKNKSKLLESKLLQWHLSRQWNEIRELARELNVMIFGDIPFYVSHDSADVWSRRSLFSVGSDGNLDMQSGVPPDYFAETGQLWGTPTYNWRTHRFSRFRWWRRRLSRQIQLFDFVRLDHFRALESYWAVPGNEKTALNGSWKKSPGYELLKLFRREFKGKMPLIAEDLGVITDAVESLRDKFLIPGMKVLQFAFDGNLTNPYLPKNIIGNRWVVYVGTHDNPTTISWWNKLNTESRSQIEKETNCFVDSPGWQLLDLALATDAFLVIATIQDLLSLDDSARFNTPGTIGDNWSWRLADLGENIEGSLKGYGERGDLFGRNFGASNLLTNYFSNR